MNDLGASAFAGFGTRALLDANPIVGEQKTGGRRFWTTRELKVIREDYPLGGLAACLPQLPGRSSTSIYQRALEMGIKRIDAEGKPREKPSYPPTPALDQAIRDLYRDGPTNEGLKSLCRLTGRPRRWFTDRAAVLGLVTPRFKEERWSAAELAILDEKAHLHPGSIRAALRKAGFARSIAGILMQLKRRGWQRGKADGHYSQTMLAECFGVSRDTLQRWAERHGLRVDRERGLYSGKTHDGAEWSVRERHLRAFVIANIALIDIRKVDKFWLVDLLTSRAGGGSQSE